MRILVVEDEASLAKQLTSSIAEAGYAVDHAADGERADFLAQTEQYDGGHVMPKLHAVVTRMPASSDRMMTAQTCGMRTIVRDILRSSSYPVTE